MKEIIYDALIGLLKKWRVIAVSVFIGFIVLGVGMVIGGLWLFNDLLTWMYLHPPINDPSWVFCYPLYHSCVNYLHWSQISDSAIELILAGAGIGGIGTFCTAFFLGILKWSNGVPKH